ncbi:hypothetical protein Drorol1_Dr00001518 [Drosera rotundifolia]
MSSCVSRGGGTNYTMTLIGGSSSPTSSPSSTISESRDSSGTISTRKPRTSRKRPNQKYNEAAALLSTACPNVFSTKKIQNPFSKTANGFSSVEEAESAELLIDFPDVLLEAIPMYQLEPVATFLPHIWPSCAKMSDGYDDQGHGFDAESMLDEEIDEGIDSIMGNARDEVVDGYCDEPRRNLCYGYPFLGCGFDLGFGFRSPGLSAFKGKEGYSDFPIVNVAEISPGFEPKVEDSNSDTSHDSHSKSPTIEDLAPSASSSARLILKLNYDEVLRAWSDRGSPFSDEVPHKKGMDRAASLAKIDLFGENGGLGTIVGGTREASVQRYKEKRRTRLVSKIGHEGRKNVTADERSRIKGRFVKSQEARVVTTEKKRSKPEAKT